MDKEKTEVVEIITPGINGNPGEFNEDLYFTGVVIIVAVFSVIFCLLYIKHLIKRWKIASEDS